MPARPIAIAAILLVAFAAAAVRWVMTGVIDESRTTGIVPSDTEARSFRMGFSIIPPDPTDPESRNFSVW